MNKETEWFMYGAAVALFACALVLEIWYWRQCAKRRASVGTDNVVELKPRAPSSSNEPMLVAPLTPVS
jgi:hypothetical protein